MLNLINWLSHVMLLLPLKKKMVASSHKSLKLSSLLVAKNCQLRDSSWEMIYSWLNQLSQQILFGKTDTLPLEIISEEVLLYSLSLLYFCVHLLSQSLLAKLWLSRVLLSIHQLIVTTSNLSTLTQPRWRPMPIKNSRDSTMLRKVRNKPHNRVCWSASVWINRKN